MRKRMSKVFSNKTNVRCDKFQKATLLFIAALFIDICGRSKKRDSTYVLAWDLTVRYLS